MTHPSTGLELRTRQQTALRQWLARSEATLLGASGIIGLLIVWQLAGHMMTENLFISSPVEVLQAAKEQISSGQLIEDTFVSLSEIFVGFALAVVVAVPLGLVMGRYRLVEYALDPFIWFFYCAPVIVFYPILIMWFGLGRGTIIALTFLFATFPIIANTVTGVKQVDPILIRAARAFGAGELQIFWQIILPSSIPAIAAGLRLGLGRAMIGTVVGEFFGANAGLGFRIAIYGTEMNISNMFAPVVVVMIIGVSLIQGLRLIEDRLERWRS